MRNSWLKHGATIGTGLLGLAAVSCANLMAGDLSATIEADWLTQPVVAASTQLPALTSQEDAAGACDGVKDGKWGFHTSQASEPWWQVDLGQPKAIARVVVWNRCDAPDRAARLQVKLSSDGRQWTTAYQHDGSVFYGFTDKKPLTVKVSNPTTRFVRIQLPGPGFLHLDEVEVYGAEDPGKNLALHQPADQVGISEWSVNHQNQRIPDWAQETRRVLEYCQQRLEQLAGQGQEASAWRPRLLGLTERSRTPKSAALDKALYLEACRLRRQLAMANPLLDFETILFTKRTPGSFNHMSDQYYGWWSKPGGGLFLLRNYKTSAPEVECLTKSFTEPGSFLRPCLSFDAQKVLFAWCRYYPQLAAETNKLDKATVPEDAFYHLYEMNLDGTGVRKLTAGKYDDFDGRYLPDGRIVFLSTRRGQALQAGRASARLTVENPALPDCYVRCGGDAQRPVAVYTLHTMNADGGELCAISPFEMFEWTPEVAHDGSIMYSRWDYIDRDNMPYMGLWATNPDGTNPRLIYKNFTHSPHCTFEPRGIPNSRKIVFTASAHHAQTMGSLVLLDPTQGTEGKSPITRLTPEVVFPEIEGWPKTYYANPYPLSEQFFLVAWGQEGITVPGPDGWARWHAVQRPPNGMAVYLFDAAGHKELLYCDNEIGCGDPIPVRTRVRPPVLASQVDWNGPAEGRFLLANVNQGLTNLPPGGIKALRVIAVPPKTHPVMNFPKMGITADDPGKCVLGTVPVEADGSAYFRVPSGVIVFFQALDARGMAVQTMRSATHVQPGQTLSCTGCHENRLQAPPGATFLASQREPSKITPGPEGSWPMRFDRLVQPVLDQHCVACHQPGGKDAQAVKLCLTGPQSYEALIRYGQPSLQDMVWTGYRRGYSIPGEGLARRSALLAYLRDNPTHAGLKLDADSLDRLVTWMDVYAQRLGSFSLDQEKDLQDFRIRLSSLLQEKTTSP